MENRYLMLSEQNKTEILNYLPTQKLVKKMATFFQNFADSTRLKILTCLCMSDMCVNDISNLLTLNQTTVSHQLQLLRSEKLVNFQRVGKLVVYRLENKAINEVMLSAVNCF